MTDQSSTRAKPSETAEGIDYSKTLFLPETAFPMRAGLPEAEPRWIERWEGMDLYKRLREDAAGRPKYVLHDGPPYANGNLHIGHALNKVLKDVITRSFQMRGRDANYVPGWDCHGLPIEWKIEEQYRAKGRNKDEIPINEFRRECRDFAAHWVDVQSAEFRRLGVEGDFADPYLTMAFEAESVIAGELLKFAMSGQVYRGSKPIMWSVVEKTALAEAEVEYDEYESDTVWVAFPVRAAQNGFAPAFKGGVSGFPKAGQPDLGPLDGAHVVIWTTTPWTLPGNRAIAYSDRVAYGLYEVTAPDDAENPRWARHGMRLVLADALAADVLAKSRVPDGGFRRLRDVSSADLAGLVCDHPLKGWAPAPTTSAVGVISPLEGEMPGRAEGGVPPQTGDTTGRNGRAEAPPSGLLPISPSRGEITPVAGVASAAGVAPISRAEGGTRSEAYAFAVPLIPGDHVTDDAGTGFVHTAPSHGREDFDVWTEHRRALEARGIDSAIPFPVDDEGFYTKDAPGFGPDAEGGPARVIDDKGKKGDANKRVIEALIARGSLLARGRLKHQYPHSWRSKKPVIFRNTPQWFVHMDKDLKGYGTSEPAPGTDTLRARALNAISETRFVPAAGQNRLHAMIADRPDWVLSRQRAWGVPICVFADENGEILKDEAVNARILDAFAKEGADAWFADGAKERFLGNEHDGSRWTMVRDILDVWFDSGSTHAFCLEKRPDLKWPADLYLEGSDQHRGWFHSSLLESCGTRGRAPYDAVLTHGFVMDEEGRKMSKSLGNVVTPQEVIKQSGADILRLWVVSSDYSEDLRLGKTILQTNVDSYRKLRNTMRWMLGTLAHDEGKTVPLAEMPELERLMLHRLAELDQLVRAGYDAFDFKRISRALLDFCVVELSAFYFDIRKDALYCDPLSSVRRIAALQVVAAIFDHLTLWLAPLLPFTAEEAWLSRKPDAVSVHLEQFPQVPAEWRNEALAAKWQRIRRVRRVVLGALEVERREKRIGSSLEASPVVYLGRVDEHLFDGLDAAEIFITSGATVKSDGIALLGMDHADLTGENIDEPPFRDDSVGADIAVRVEKPEGRKCARSWKILPEVGSDPDFPDVTPRDAEALRELKAAGRLAA